MDILALLLSAALPWAVGIVLMMLLRHSRVALAGPGEVPWLLGTGYLAGAFALTLWMRVLSMSGVKFGVLVVALPLTVLTIPLGVVVWRRAGRTAVVEALRASGRGLRHALLEDPLRIVWWMVLAWLAVRYTLLAVEVTTRPLYPWDAWTQWATKARVWYELGYLAPFGRLDAWLAAGGALYFDASPEYPPTMPLLQVWTSLCLGRWDDVLMNWPWWQMSVALTLAMYGGLRSLELPAIVALLAAFLIASIPLANVHVALAGYADLPLAAFYGAAVLALLRWARARSVGEALACAWFALACTQTKNPGLFWALTLVPAAIVVLFPRHGMRIALGSFALGAFLLVAVARLKLQLFLYRVDLNYDPPWADLGEGYFLLGNWHLLWYGMILVAIFAWRDLFSRAMGPITVITLGGLLFLFFVFGFTNASAFIADQTTVNRATLHMAPAIVIFLVLGWSAFARRWTAAPAVAPGTP